VRRIVNPISTGATRWWCHSAIRRSVRRDRAARVTTVRLTTRTDSRVSSDGD
jgi:hypothetical protein